MVVKLLGEFWHPSCPKRMKTGAYLRRPQDYIKNTVSYECLGASFPLLLSGCLGIIRIC